MRDSRHRRALIPVSRGLVAGGYGLAALDSAGSAMEAWPNT
jgi:hypothetical protein